MPVIIINDRNNPFHGRSGIIVRVDGGCALVAFPNGQSFWFTQYQYTIQMEYSNA